MKRRDNLEDNIKVHVTDSARARVWATFICPCTGSSDDFCEHDELTTRATIRLYTGLKILSGCILQLTSEYNNSLRFPVKKRVGGPKCLKYVGRISETLSVPRVEIRSRCQ